MRVLEAADVVGGGMRTEELTLPGLRARRLLGDSSARRRVAVLPDGAARRARRRVDRVARGARASVRRRDGGAARALGRGDGRDARPRRAAVRAHLRAARPQLRRCSSPTSSAPLGDPVASARVRPVQRARRAAGGGARAARVPRAARPRLLRGHERALAAAALAAGDRGVRAHARDARPRRRLAVPARRLAEARRRARRAPPLARRRDRDRHARRVARRARRRAGDPPRRHAAPARRDGRRPAPVALPAAAREVPLRAGRLQARLGARRPDPVDGGGVRARRDRPPRRHARGDRRLRARAVARRRRARGRTSSSRSRASSTRRARPRGSRPRGRTATSRTARRST